MIKETFILFVMFWLRKEPWLPNFEIQSLFTKVAHMFFFSFFLSQNSTHIRSEEGPIQKEEWDFCQSRKKHLPLIPRAQVGSGVSEAATTAVNGSWPLLQFCLELAGARTPICLLRNTPFAACECKLLVQITTLSKALQLIHITWEIAT